jgi:hypothetical protein
MVINCHSIVIQQQLQRMTREAQMTMNDGEAE